MCTKSVIDIIFYDNFFFYYLMQKSQKQNIKNKIAAPLVPPVRKGLKQFEWF